MCRSTRCGRGWSQRAQDWRWSSTRAHLAGNDDGITARAPIKERFPDFADLLAGAADADAFARLRAAESIGRPLGDDRFLARVERLNRRAGYSRANAGQSRRERKAVDTHDRRAMRFWIKCTVTLIPESSPDTWSAL